MKIQRDTSLDIFRSLIMLPYFYTVSIAELNTFILSIYCIVGQPQLCTYFYKGGEWVLKYLNLIFLYNC